MFHIKLDFIIVFICYILTPTPSIGGALFAELSGVKVPPLHVQITSLVAPAHLVLECGLGVMSFLLVLAVSTVVADVDSVRATVELVLLDTLCTVPLSSPVGGLATAVSVAIDHLFNPCFEGSLLFRGSLLFNQQGFVVGGTGDCRVLCCHGSIISGDTEAGWGL